MIPLIYDSQTIEVSKMTYAEVLLKLKLNVSIHLVMHPANFCLQSRLLSNSESRMKRERETRLTFLDFFLEI